METTPRFADAELRWFLDALDEFAAEIPSSHHQQVASVAGTILAAMARAPHKSAALVSRQVGCVAITLFDARDLAAILDELGYPVFFGKLRHARAQGRFSIVTIAWGEASFFCVRLRHVLFSRVEAG